MAADEILLFDKPIGWSSFDVIRRLKPAMRGIKMGHAGTLDPLATGLLVICTGKMTKQIEKIQGAEKEYTCTIRLGEITPSYDAETQVSEQFEISHITAAMIDEVIPQFLGDCLQTPPLHSAKKINGRRAYQYARKGVEVELTPAKVHIREIGVTNIALPNVSLRVVCSKGTYIRSLAHDLGKALRSGGYLTQLVRTRIGDFRLQDAWQVDDFILNQKKETSQPLPQSVENQIAGGI